MSLNVENLCFGYNSEYDILNNINMEVKQGEAMFLLQKQRYGKDNSVEVYKPYFKTQKRKCIFERRKYSGFYT